MLMGLINSSIFVKRYVCSDINKDLIELWKKVKKSPDEIYESYEKLWKELNKDNDIDRKRKFFEEQRRIYNEKITKKIISSMCVR
jgi:DNA adenine methylase